jgi:hypothetical protein
MSVLFASIAWIELSFVKVVSLLHHSCSPDIVPRREYDRDA